MTVGLNFQNPSSLFIQGVARQHYEVNEPSVFKNKKTLKPLDKKDNTEESIKLNTGLPSQISD